MPTGETKGCYTPQDLLKMQDGASFELVDGELIERQLGCEAAFVSGELLARLMDYCDEKELGWVLTSKVGYQCFPDSPAKVRRTSVSFIRLKRVPWPVP